MAIFTAYILPFLAFGLIVAALALRVRSLGGPGMIVVVLFAIALGPSLLYAAIADESSLPLFTASLVAALAVSGFMLFRNKKWNKPPPVTNPFYDTQETRDNPPPPKSAPQGNEAKKLALALLVGTILTVLITALLFHYYTQTD